MLNQEERTIIEAVRKCPESMPVIKEYLDGKLTEQELQERLKAEQEKTE